MRDAAVVDVPLGVADVEEDTVAVNRDTRVEGLLNEWQLPFELDAAFPLARVKVEETTQIRSEAHRAPKGTVDQYATHMNHGAVFPPIVVSTDGRLIDGNARLAAARILKLKTFPTYKVKFPHLGIAKMIGAALNQLGGDRLADDEIIIAAEAMMDEGYADEAIARTLGRSVSHVRNVRRDRLFRESADRIGLSKVRLPKAVARVLAGISHDEPLKAAIALVHRANPAMKDVSRLVNDVEKTRSDADALAVIQNTETKWGPVTGPPPVRKPANQSKAKKALSQVKALLELTEGILPTELVIPDDANAAQLWQQLNSLATNVVAVYATQRS